MADTPVAGSSTGGDPERSYARTPQQALNLTKIVAVGVTPVVLLLSFVTWILLSEPSHSNPAMSPLEPVPMVLLLVGLGVTAASPLFMRQLGCRAARSWADAGRRGDQVARRDLAAPSTMFGLEVGPAAAVAGTLWDRFWTISLIGAALPEVVLLTGFVVTVATLEWPLMAGSVVVYFVFWGTNFPRRSTWDGWADSAGLALPWDAGSPAAAGTVASIPPPEIPTRPR